MGHKPQLCAKFHHAVELIGGRWTGALIHLLMDGRLRFAELRTAVPEISDRMLSERLRELETEGIVERIVVPDTPVRVEYELTEKGHALEQALAAVGKWAERWVTCPPPGADAENPTRATRQSATASRPAAAASARARR